MSTPTENVAGADRQPVDAVQRWVDLAIITPEQASAIRADLVLHPEQAPTTAASLGSGGPPAPSPLPTPRPGTHASLVAEALGYLGGAIILVALGLVAGQFWPDLSTGVRLLLAAAATVVTLLAGAAVPLAVGAAAARLRSVLWLISTALGAGFLSVLSGETFGWQEAGQALFVATGTAALAALLWYRHHHLLQHLATVAALVGGVMAATALLPRSETSPTASAWALGVAWYLLGWSGVLRPPRQAQLVGAVVIGMMSASFAAEPWGSPLALLTLAALAVLAVRLRDLPLLGIAAMATLITLPPIVTRYFRGTLPAAGVLLVVGTLLVLAAVLTIRRRGAPGTPAAAAPAWGTGSIVQGWVGAALVLAVTAAAVLIAALV